MKQTRHIGVYGLVIEDEKILLVKKCRGAYTGQYDLPGGSIEHGEKPIETLKRELQEETNTKVKNATLLDANSVIVEWLHHDTPEQLHHIGIIYEVILTDTKVKEDADGHDSLGAVWCNIKDLSKKDISPLTLEALLLKGYSIK